MFLASTCFPAFTPASSTFGCVVSVVAALTERREIRVGAIARIVVQVRNGKHDPHHAFAIEKRNLGLQALDDPPVFAVARD